MLAVGSTLTAPENLNGRWTAAGPGGRWPGVTVEQSGRYFELAFDNGPTMGATMVGPPTAGRLTLARGPWRVTVNGPAGTDAARTFHVDGPTAGTFTGRRDARPSTGPAAQ